MTSFALIAVLLACAVLLCLLPPLLRRDGAGLAAPGHGQANLAVLRDQARELDADLAAGTMSAEAHAAARGELAVRVLEDVGPAGTAAAAPRQLRTALALALALPLVAVSLYLYLGEPDGLTVAPAGMNARAPQHDTPADVGAMVDALAERLRKEPGDIEGWRMLARSYSALDRHADAARTYAALAKALPGEAGVLADWADALGTAQGGTLGGEPERLIARALALDPRHVKALSLAGSAAFERGDFLLAERQWQAVLALIPADSAFARSTAASIDAARRSRGEATAGSNGAPAAAAVLSGTVSLAPALRGSVRPDDTVFIFARAADGAGPPLAALRRKAGELPIAFTLDDSMAMGGASLSGQQKIMLGARISRSGSATPAPGDLEGAAGPVAPGANGIEIAIARKRN